MQKRWWTRPSCQGFPLSLSARPQGALCLVGQCFVFLWILMHKSLSLKTDSWKQMIPYQQPQSLIWQSILAHFDILSVHKQKIALLVSCLSDHLVQRWPTSHKCSWSDYAEAWTSFRNWTGSTVWCWSVPMCGSQSGWSGRDISQLTGVWWVEKKSLFT